MEKRTAEEIRMAMQKLEDRFDHGEISEKVFSLRYQSLKEELNEYISSLLKAAGNTNDIFTPQAIEVIYSLSKGVPRLINNIAIASLMYGCATKKDFIDEEAVYQGQKDFEL